MSPQPIRFTDLAVLRRIPRLWLPMGLVLAAVLWFVQQRDADRDLALTIQRGADTVRQQVQLVERELESSTATLVHLAEASELRAVLRGGPGGARLGEEYARLSSAQPSISRVYALDPRGRIRVDSHPAIVAERVEVPGALRVGLGRGQVHVADLAPSGRTGRLVIELSAPIVDSGGERLGALVLEDPALGMAARLDHASRSIPGWCFLIDGQGRYVLDPLGKDRGLANGYAGAAFAEDHPEMWEKMHGLRQGAFLLDSGHYTFRSVPSVAPGPPVAAEELTTTLVYFAPPRIVFEESRRALKRMLLVSLLLGAVLLGLAWRLAHADAVRDANQDALAASEARLRELARRLLRLQEEERRAVARDLHDELGQIATAVTIDLKRAEKTDEPEKRARLVESAREGVEGLLASMRALLGRLRASTIEDLGLRGALEALFRELGEAYGVAVEATLDLAEEPAHDTALTAYRVVQEALTNVARHAGVPAARVRVAVLDDQLELEIADAGAGFDPHAGAPGHLGLVGMRERVALAGGRLDIEARPGEGTRVHARLPLHGPPDETGSEEGAGGR